MTDDILKIFSNFDGRLREKLSGDGVEQNLNSLDRRISCYISADAPLWSNSANFSSFLDSVDQLIAAVREWSPLADHKNISSCLHRAEDLLRQSMSRLEDEFRALIERGDFTGDEDNDDSVEDDDVVIVNALPEGTAGDLNEIAKRMVAAGHGKECSHVYITCRRELLEQRLSRLGLQKLRINEVQKMQWTQLEDEIEKWIKAINVTIRILYPSERRLCDGVFFGFSSVADLCFMEVCRGSTIQLLNFADAVAIDSRSPERLFKLLDIYETVRDLMPEFDLIFSDDYCLSLRNEAITILKKLGEVIRGIFMELENLIRLDPAKSVVPGGGLHPITRYVMNYLGAACRSRQTLEQVFEESNVDYRKGDERVFSSLAIQMALIMELLESNLEAKSKVYRDNALCSVFMMNNGRSIVQKVKDNELGAVLGDDWIREHMAKVRQYHVSYRRNSWSKVLGVLKVDNNNPLSSDGASKNLREKLKLFNSYFDEICRTQSSWVIFDEQLREELRISVSGTLSPAYRNFIGRLQVVADLWKHADRYIRYSVEDIEAKISELFQGTGTGKR